MEELIDVARTASMESFVESSEREAQTVVRVGLAFEMVMVLLKIKCGDFVSEHQTILNIIKDADTRMEFVDGTTMRFYSGTSQIAVITGNHKNIPLYKAMYFLYHYDVGEDDEVDGMKTGKNLIEHFEKTKTHEHFIRIGGQYKKNLETIMTWIVECIDPPAP